MNSIWGTIARLSASQTFRRSFALTLIAEAVTIGAAWLLLDFNVSGWIHARSAAAARISQQAAKRADWSQVDTLPADRASSLNGVPIRIEFLTSLFDRYRGTLTQLSNEYFRHNEGDVYLVVVRGGQEYRIDPFDPHPMDPFENANNWELAAYASGKATYMLAPYSDVSGTYLAGYTPIFRNGKVVGLIAAEYDSATLSEFRSLVRKVFWLSILPALLLSLVVAYVLAGMFVEPMEIFRSIDETAATRSASATSRDDPLSRLSPREREVAELVRRGLKNKEIAEQLFVTSETVKQHLKNIREKTGFTRVELAVHVAASSIQPVLETPAPA